MRKLVGVLAVLLGLCAPVNAGSIDGTPITVRCGTTVTVNDNNAFGTLTLDASDPILSTVCQGDGLTIKNQGAGHNDRGFTVDCTGTSGMAIKGSSTGVGIKLLGPNLAVFGCTINGFQNGLTVTGDGSDVEDSLVASSSGDGFVVNDPVSFRNANLIGSNFTGNQAISTGGWGFNLKGSVMNVGTGSFFNNIATGNALGGFLVKGEGVSMSGNEALSNNGPGFSVLSTNCCSGSLGQFFSSSLAAANAGPGIVYTGKDDGSNCVGSLDPNCTGGKFFPAGFDATPGAIVSSGNGTTCPAGSLPFIAGVCPIVKGKQCSENVLNHCP
jgi:hypothetical protein